MPLGLNALLSPGTEKKEINWRDVAKTKTDTQAEFFAQVGESQRFSMSAMKVKMF